MAIIRVCDICSTEAKSQDNWLKHWSFFRGPDNAADDPDNGIFCRECTGIVRAAIDAARRERGQKQQSERVG